MKSYLRLFLISISFTFILNVAQAETGGVTPEEPEHTRLPDEQTVWKLVNFDKDGKEINVGTAFAIAKDTFVTAFSTIEENPSIEKMVLRQGDKELSFAKLIGVSVVDSVAILIFTSK